MRIPLRDVTSLPGPGDFLPPDGIDPMEEHDAVMNYIEENYDDLLAEITQDTIETQDMYCLLYDLLTTDNDETKHGAAEKLNQKFYEYVLNKLENQDEY